HTLDTVAESRASDALCRAGELFFPKHELSPCEAVALSKFSDGRRWPLGRPTAPFRPDLGYTALQRSSRRRCLRVAPEIAPRQFGRLPLSGYSWQAGSDAPMRSHHPPSSKRTIQRPIA